MKTFFRFAAVLLALTLVGGYVYSQAGGNLIADLGLDRIRFDSGRDARMEELQAQVDALQQKLDKTAAELAAASEVRTVKKEPAREEDLPPITIGLQVPNVPPVSTWKQPEPTPAAKPRTTEFMPSSKSDVVFAPRDLSPPPPRPTKTAPTVRYQRPVYPRQASTGNAPVQRAAKQSVQQPAETTNNAPNNDNSNKRALMMGSKSARIIAPDDVNPPANHASSGSRAPQGNR